MEGERPLLGESIEELVRALLLTSPRLGTQAILDRIATETGYSQDTVYRWRQGRAVPRPETLETLATLGENEGRLNRE